MTDPADEIFRADAIRLGYLVTGEKGEQGMARYYADHGMISPTREREDRRAGHLSIDVGAPWSNQESLEVAIPMRPLVADRRPDRRD